MRPKTKQDQQAASSTWSSSIYILAETWKFSGLAGIHSAQFAVLHKERTPHYVPRLWCLDGRCHTVGHDDGIFTVKHSRVNGLIAAQD
jgi:hypothetical protein